MSTHALIALMLDPAERRVEAVYVHLDGGPGRLGRLLLNCYDSPALVEAILAVGDLHALGPTLDAVEYIPIDPPVAARDGDLWTLARDCAAEYVYVYDDGGDASERGWWWSPTAKRDLRPLTSSATVPPHLRSADGVDAGAYTVSEPLTVESVLERAAAVRRAQRDPAPDGMGGWSYEEAHVARADLYRDVLSVVAATDRYGPFGALARAALTAEE